MKDLKHWQNIIQEKRKDTDFQEFWEKITSWFVVVFSKNRWHISRFPETPRSNAIAIDEFEKLRDDLVKSWKEYKKDASFFDQFGELLRITPLPYMIHHGVGDNIEYSDNCVDAKNAYLSTGVLYGAEDTFYSLWSIASRQIYNSFWVNTQSEIVHFWKGISQSFKVFYSSFISGSSDIWFSSNLIWCQECILCDGLTNVGYHIKNIPYEKEEYFKKKQEMLEQKQLFGKLYETVFHTWKSYDDYHCSGNYIRQSENIENGVFVENAKNGKNVVFAGWWKPIEEFYDCFSAGGLWKSDYYAASQSGGGEHVYCSVGIIFSSAIFYSYYLEGCSFCLGCVWLRNKSYCILNTQYTKDEWLRLVDQIFSQMHSQWTLWDFFPGEINPFYYNDTAASFLGNRSRQDVLDKWYLWRDSGITIEAPAGANIISVDDISRYESYQDGIWKIDRDICKKVIQDSQGNAFVIISQECSFYEKYGLPLPRIHWRQRIFDHFNSINFIV